VEAAAERYFGVSAAQLDARQSALLAAALPDPRRSNPAAPSRYLAARAAIISARAERVRLHRLPGAGADRRSTRLEDQEVLVRGRD
jgi:monofunctional biosynthetic peptidoglycan transglycosylase